MNEKVKMRFGRLENEVITICKLGADSSTCDGIKCTQYQDCFKELNPDINGYIKFEKLK